MNTHTRTDSEISRWPMYSWETSLWSWIRCKARRGVMGRALCSTLLHRVFSSVFGGKCDTMFKSFPPSQTWIESRDREFFTFTKNKSNPHGTYLITVICNFERNSQLQRKITLNSARALMDLRVVLTVGLSFGGADF